MHVSICIRKSVYTRTFVCESVRESEYCVSVVCADACGEKYNVWRMVQPADNGVT